MGGGNSPRFEIERFIFLKYRLGAIESDVAAPDCNGIAGTIRFAKYDSLDQIDRDWKTAVPAVRADRRLAC